MNVTPIPTFTFFLLGLVLSNAACYEIIQAFKRSRTAVFGGINFANVVAPYLYDMSIAGLFRKLVFSLFFGTRIVAREDSGRELLLFFSCREKRRSDYDFIFDRLREVTGDHCDYAESSERFDPLQWLRTIRFLPAALNSVAGYRVSSIQRFVAALLIAKHLSSTQVALTPLLSGRRRLVTFCDACPPENLLAQAASAAGIDTVTAQHGQYRVLNAGNMSGDAEAYANFVSQRMLCWGEATRAEFVRIGFAPERFVITGWIKDWGDLAPRKADFCPGVFGVMLNGENSKESNYTTIRAANTVAKALNLRYLIRLHPLNKPRDYFNTINEYCIGLERINVGNYIKKVNFSIAHTSAAMIEMLYAQSPVYLLDDGRLAEVFRVNGLCYANAQEIIAAIKLDADMENQGQSRLAALSKWYNDDSEQISRIRQAILEQEF